jgi:hypothetical protein
MDPLTIIAATDSTLASGQVIATGTRAAIRSLILFGTYDPKWISLGALDGKQQDFSAETMSDIHQFLSSETMKPTLALLAIGTLVSDSEDSQTVIETGQKVFSNECEKWSKKKGASWHKHSQMIYTSLIEVYASAVPATLKHDGAQDEINTFSNFLRSPLTSDTKGTSAKYYVARLIKILEDLPSLTQATSTSMELAAIIQSAGPTPIISHTNVEKSVGFEELYVGRDFEEVASRNIYPSNDLIRSNSPFRLFIMGAPGAGKTTFVKYFASAVSDSEVREVPLPSVVIRCRDYARENWSESIRNTIKTRLDVDTQSDVSVEIIDIMLTLGRLVIIFDGLDEIVDVARRQEMVKRIQAFTTQFPPCSVLVTTRELGYEQAPLSPKLFTGVRLKEFSDDQVEEYCQQWFAANDRPKLVQHFMRDSSTVTDLRKNPLLLSLLCILYRASGAIPTNRRAIYEECAKLLFHKWDQSRQITTHDVMPEYGNELMQEIARFFFKSESAQAGIQEQILVKILAVRLETNIGYSGSKAHSVAAEFAEYCAGRAWLLGVQGTSDGQRMFSFTHRTFYEYFAAEAYARDGLTPEAVASRIIDSYKKDSTSVLPELLLQSFGAHVNQGDSEVFKAVCHLSPDAVLLLRLMNGARLPSLIREEGLPLILRQWSAEGKFGDSFAHLLSTNEASRDYFIEEYLLAPRRQGERELFIAGWASLSLTGSSAPVHEVWALAVDQILTNFADEVEQYASPATVNWLLGLGWSPTTQIDGWEYLVCDSPHGWVPGILWWSAESALVRNHGMRPTEDLLRNFTRLLEEGLLFPEPVLERLVDSLSGSHPELLRWDVGTGELSEIQLTARNAIALIVLGMSETAQPFTGLLDTVSLMWPGHFAGLPEYRLWREGRGPGSRRRGPEYVEETLNHLPQRVRNWSTGDESLIDPDLYAEDEMSRRFSDDPIIRLAERVTFRYIPPARNVVRQHRNRP